ncbi:GIY-YIG nuclease family protein [Faecalimonas sp.]
MNIGIKIDFFSNNLVEAIGAGIYKISVINSNGDIAPLYIGESVFVLVRCATHLFELKRNPKYFGFTEKTISSSEITLKFELLQQIEDRKKRKRYEKEVIKQTLQTQKLICQGGISDRMKDIDDKIESLTSFLNSK